MLFETAAGYAIFKVSRSLYARMCSCYVKTVLITQLLDEGKLQSADDLYRQFENAETATKL